MEKRYRQFMAELRAEPDAPTQFVGYACVFNVDSLDLGGFKERIKPGAFEKALSDPDIDVVCCVDHDTTRGILGRYCPRIGANTLQLREDDHGLFIECEIPDTQLGRDTMVSMKRGDVRQMSFCFQPTEDETAEDGVREVISCDIHDVSIVVFPAYEQTEVQLRHDPERTRLDTMRRRLLLACKVFGF